MLAIVQYDGTIKHWELKKTKQNKTKKKPNREPP